MIDLRLDAETVNDLSVKAQRENKTVNFGMIYVGLSAGHAKTTPIR